jgi:hypothetical protein
MKEYQTLIGLSLIALAIFFGLQSITMTEFDACIKNAYKTDGYENEIEQYKYCGYMVKG